MPSNPTKAIIRNIATKEEVECQFNPNEYTLSKTNQWTNKPKKGANVGKTDFGGGQPAELKLQLFFRYHEPPQYRGLSKTTLR